MQTSENIHFLLLANTIKIHMTNWKHYLKKDLPAVLLHVLLVCRVWFLCISGFNVCVSFRLEAVQVTAVVHEYHGWVVLLMASFLC